MLDRNKIHEMYEKYLTYEVDAETLYKLLESIHMTEKSNLSFLYYEKMENFDEVMEKYTPSRIAKMVAYSTNEKTFNIKHDYFKSIYLLLHSKTEKEYFHSLRCFEENIITEYLMLLDEYNTNYSFDMEVVGTFNLDRYVPYDLIDYYLS